MAGAPGKDPSPPRARSREALAVLSANAGLALAVLFYMGWAYTNAWLAYFHVNPLNLEIGITEYALRGLRLFSPPVVLITAAIVVAIELRLVELPAMADPPQTLLQRAVGQVRDNCPRWIRSAGLTVAVCGLVLYFAAYHVSIPTYAVLVLLGTGPLIVASAHRETTTARYAYSLAVVTAVLCGLWAGALYADEKGTQEGRRMAGDLNNVTAAVVLSAHRLDITGPGVRSEPLPKGGEYAYRYTGLRLLIARGGNYYLLPVGWTRNLDATYVLQDDDGIRVELYAGTR
jgi:hypothetical protein